jgi:hypothetical protein
MKEPRDVGVAIHDRFFTLDVGIEDEDLIMCIMAGLALYVRKGNSIKVRQSYVTFLVAGNHDQVHFQDGAGGGVEQGNKADPLCAEKEALTRSSH